MAEIRLEGVSKSYENDIIVEDFNLTIPNGVFFALLGPSGCGKTTVLRLIAGLESVDKGHIFMNGVEITNTPVYKRKINTVFQRYALFPHMTVAQNISYGLKIRGYKTKDVQEKVAKYIKNFKLEGKENRYPESLSGGQQQRVALARALIVEPEVVLFDEPLSALDMKLKEQMLVEIAELQYTLKTTFVYVTHDQSEAISLADQIAIINTDGKVEQQGTPRLIYQNPCSTFVANFVGSSNIVGCVLQASEGKHFCFEIPEIGTFYALSTGEKNWMIPGKHAFACIRPERIVILRERSGKTKNSISVTISNIIYYGSYIQYRTSAANGQLFIVFVQNKSREQAVVFAEDEQVFLEFDEQDVNLVEF